MLYKERMALADGIIFLDFNRFLCLFRVIKRWYKNRGKTRPDMGEGCPEKIDAEFLSWVLYKGRKSASRRRKLKALREINDKPVYILKTPRQVRNFIRDFRVTNPANF